MNYCKFHVLHNDASFTLIPIFTQVMIFFFTSGMHQEKRKWLQERQKYLTVFAPLNITSLCK